MTPTPSADPAMASLVEWRRIYAADYLRCFRAGDRDHGSAILLGLLVLDAQIAELRGAPTTEGVR